MDALSPKPVAAGVVVMFTIGVDDVAVGAVGQGTVAARSASVSYAALCLRCDGYCDCCGLNAVDSGDVAVAALATDAVVLNVVVLSGLTVSSVAVATYAAGAVVLSVVVLSGFAMSAVAVRNVAANTVASAVYTVTKEFYGLGLFA